MPATRETPTGTKNLQGATTLPQRIRRWLQEKNISQWLKRSRAKKIEQPLAAKHDHQGPKAMGRKPLQPAGPRLGLDDLNSDFLNHEQRFSPGISYEPAAKHDAAQSRPGSYPSVYIDPTLPSRETNTLSEFGGHADTSHTSISQSYNPSASFEETYAYSDGAFESQTYGRCVPFGGSGFDKRDPLWNPNNHTFMVAPRTEPNSNEANQNPNMSTFSRNYRQQSTTSPMLRGNYQQRNQKYHLGTQSAFAQPMNVLLSNMTYSPNVTPEFPTRYIESQKQPQSYDGQRQPTSVMTNTNDSLGRPGINAHTQSSFFQSGDFRYVQPRTAAEVAFVRSALDYTRAEYKSWMSVEPPESSSLASYAEQYGKIQEHLEENWPFLDSPPVKLRAIGPVFGGLDQW